MKEDKVLKVCIICEGSYPYVSGGVSSWVQTLIENYSDIEFVIWSIATTKEEMSNYKYNIPANVKSIETFYISDYKMNGTYKTVKLKPNDARILKNLLVDDLENIDWKNCIDFMKRYQKSLIDILMGKDFFEIALELYKNEYKRASFNEFLWSLRGMYFPFMKILSENIVDADIYHAVSTGYAGILGSIASNVKNKPFLLSEHGIYTREREEDIIRSNWLKGSFKELWVNFFKKMSLISYSQASIVTSLFETNKTLQIELGCPEDKIEIIPNGVDVEALSNLPVRSEESKKYFNIGAIVRIVPIKDIKTMLLAFLNVKKLLPNARLNILGNYDEDPEYYEECRQLVDMLLIEDVVFHGQVDILKHINDFDLLLLTSISEGQPLSVLEGMAAGIPYICTNVGDCKTLLEGNENDDLGEAGFIVPVMDTTALTKKIVNCANNKDKLLKMGLIGKKRVSKYYKKEYYLDKFREIYKELGEAKVWQV